MDDPIWNQCSSTHSEIVPFHRRSRAQQGKANAARRGQNPKPAIFQLSHIFYGFLGQQSEQARRKEALKTNT